MLELPRVALFDSLFWTRVLPAAVIALTWLAGNTMSFQKRGEV